MAKKADKRLQRRQLKLGKTLEKTARQFAAPDPSRVTAEGATPSPDKTISDAVAKPTVVMMQWNRELEDFDDWSWGDPRRTTDSQWAEIVEPFLLSCAAKQWKELDQERTGKGRKRRMKHIHYDYSKLIEEAYDRLVEREIDDFAPSIFRFRISGKKRLYGFRVEPMFHMVWYDPHHLLYAGKRD